MRCVVCGGEALDWRGLGGRFCGDCYEERVRLGCCQHYPMGTESVSSSPWGNWDVYVLVTDYGHYVGHTGDIDSRLPQHWRGEVPSTKGGNPSLVWSSNSFKRGLVRDWEAKLKRSQCSGSGYFKRITGFPSVPYRCSSCS